DPATLGPLPPDLRADGNAYRLELAYSPSNQPIDALVAPGNVILTVPHQAAALLFAADGRTWDRLAIGTSGDPTVVGGSFSRAGRPRARRALARSGPAPPYRRPGRGPHGDRCPADELPQRDHLRRAAHPRRRHSPARPRPAGRGRRRRAGRGRPPRLPGRAVP